MDRFISKRFDKVKRVIEGVLFNATKTFKLLGLMSLTEPKDKNAQILYDIHQRIRSKVKKKRSQEILDNCFPFPFALYNVDLVYHELGDLYIQEIINHRTEFSWKKNINSKDLRINYKK